MLLVRGALPELHLGLFISVNLVFEDLHLGFNLRLAELLDLLDNVQEVLLNLLALDKPFLVAVVVIQEFQEQFF